MVEISLCGAVDFLAAIFERDRDVLRARYGILPKGCKAYCLNCGKPTKKRLYCSLKCRHEYTQIPLVCPVCDKLFYQKKSHVLYHAKTPFPSTGKLQDHFFCSRQCFGTVLGTTYGFKAHPEIGRENGGRPRKWDYTMVYTLRKETGWGCVKLSRALGIPEPTISGILAREKSLDKTLV